MQHFHRRRRPGLSGSRELCRNSQRPSLCCRSPHNAYHSFRTSKIRCSRRCCYPIHKPQVHFGNRLSRPLAKDLSNSNKPVSIFFIMATSSTYDMPATGAAIPFQPNLFQLCQIPLFEQNDVPRYLFRLYTPSTAGQTTDSYIMPPASICGQAETTRDIFRLPPKEAATRLNEHLRWWRSHESKCNLMSWTSSLLFALQHGLRRH